MRLIPQDLKDYVRRFLYYFMTYYPVIIPTLNRYDHFKECIESLKLNTHSDKTEIIIGLDYPPTEVYEDGWGKIKKYLSELTGFGKITVIEHKHNLGAIANSDYIRDYALCKYDAFIYSEDDNIFSPCFLDYMDKCLEKYKDRKEILAITGYMNPIDWKTKSNSNVVYVQDYMAWGIGCWKRTWTELNSNMPEHYMSYVCSHRTQLKKLRNNLRELHQLVFWTKSNPTLDRKCDFTINCYCLINDKYIIAPKMSLVRNMGNDGSGINCIKLENDYLARQEISSSNSFDIIDAQTSREAYKIIKEWSDFKNQSFTIRQTLLTIFYYYLCLLGGIKTADSVLNTTKKFKRLIKR